MAIQYPVVVIVGPTASGKTAAAFELAQKYPAEIICADSRTLYRGLDIGTAKPSLVEQKIPHWGLDLIDPDERFSAAEFKQYAQNAIQDIQSRGKIPIVVGGTGLYIDALIFDYTFGPARDNDLRKKLEQFDFMELKKYCIENNIELPKNENNRRHLIGAIERQGAEVSRQTRPGEQYIVVGITTEKSTLMERIASRFDAMIASGVVDEARRAIDMYGTDAPGLSGSIYRLIAQADAEGYAIDELKRRVVTSDWQLAKRQRTWFARNKCIHWLDSQAVVPYLASLLEKRTQM